MYYQGSELYMFGLISHKEFGTWLSSSFSIIFVFGEGYPKDFWKLILKYLWHIKIQEHLDGILWNVFRDHLKLFTESLEMHKLC